MVQGKIINEWYGFPVINCTKEDWVKKHLYCTVARSITKKFKVVVICMDCHVCRIDNKL